MPYPVQNLIEGCRFPVCAIHTEPAQDALERMIVHNYSQLPVIDEENRPLGMVTYESIVRAIKNLAVTVEQVQVADALIKVPKNQQYQPEDDLFDMLDRLMDVNAVLIVDVEGKLIGIVTSYDSTEYFRKRAEDMMIVEDIENMIKDLILIAFLNSDGNIDQSVLDQAIEDIINSQQKLKADYGRALTHYLRLQGEIEGSIDQIAMQKSFTEMLPPKRIKGFDQLTFYDYIELLLHRGRWEFYKPIFGQERFALRNLLESVRNIRNQLAHFRGEITASQRDQLRYCSDWLGDHLSSIPVNLPDELEVIASADEIEIRESVKAYVVSPETEHEIISTEAIPRVSTSRYASLSFWLKSNPLDEEQVLLSFKEIENIISGDLPMSARKHRAWWANDPVGHSHARQWLDAGWKVSYVNMADEKVIFARFPEDLETE